jgi:hypothetical protein
MEVIGVETLRKVREFQQAGGNVIAVARLPQKAAEPGKDAEVVALLKEIFGQSVIEADQEHRQRLQFRVEASSEWAPGGHSPLSAFDLNPDTRWNSVDKSENGQWLKVIFPEPVEISTVRLLETFDRIAGFQIQTFDTGKNDWITHASGGQMGRMRHQVSFPAIKTKELRLLFDHPGQDSISISLVDILDKAGNYLTHTPPSRLTSNNAMVIFDNPEFSVRRYDKELRQALRDGDVQFANEDSLPAGSPTGSCMVLHRIIHGRDVYFFTNSTSETIDTTVLLRNAQSRRWEWWNPHDGNRSQAIQSDGKTAIPLKLGPVESRFLIGISDRVTQALVRVNYRWQQRLPCRRWRHCLSNR